MTIGFSVGKDPDFINLAGADSVADIEVIIDGVQVEMPVGLNGWLGIDDVYSPIEHGEADRRPVAERSITMPGCARTDPRYQIGCYLRWIIRSSLTLIRDD